MVRHRLTSGPHSPVSVVPGTGRPANVQTRYRTFVFRIAFVGVGRCASRWRGRTRKAPRKSLAQLSELAKNGTVNVRHAHGDWKSNNLSGWIEKLHPNSTDPAVRLHYREERALMTSDSDFTPLVMRILESGMPVYGFGEKKTPLPFVHACSQFIFIENLITKPEAWPEKSGGQTKLDLAQDSGLLQLLRNAADQTSDIDG